MRTRNVYYYHVNRREAHKYLVWSQEMYKYITRHNGFQTGVTKECIEWESFYCGLLTQDTPHDKQFKWTYEFPIKL